MHFAKRNHRLIINGIMGKPSRSDEWTDRRARHIQLYSEDKATSIENAFWLIRTKRRRWHYAQELAKVIKAYNNAGVRPHIEAHSNGNVLVLMALHLNSSLLIHTFTMLFPAAWASFRKNKLNNLLLNQQVNRVIFVGSKNDQVVKWGGGLTRWLSPIGYGYGTLSFTGPQEVSEMVADRVRIVWMNHWGHSTFSHPDNMNQFFENLYNSKN